METERAVDNAVDKPVDEAARLAAQKQRSIWLALALFGFVILIGITSALQLKENIQRNSNTNTGANIETNIESEAGQ